MDPREPLEALPALARVRDSFPVLSAMMPSTRRDLVFFELVVITLVAIPLANVYRITPDRPQVPLLIVCVLFAIGGVRRGQDNYAAELGRASDLSLLVGAAPGEAYYRATSKAVRRQAIMLAPAFLSMSIVVQLLSGAGIAEALALAVPVVAVPSAALLLRDVVAHGAVLAQGVVVPQYFYVAAGLVLGVGLQQLGARGGGGGALPAADLSGLGLLAAAGGLAVWIALDRLVQLSRRVPEVDASSIAVPRRRARVSMPLWVFLWRARGRKKSSIVIGFTAIVTVLMINFEALARGLPTLDNPYAKPEVAVIVVYAAGYLLATLVATPLDLPTAVDRSLLIRLVSGSGIREMTHSVGAVLIPALALSLVTAVLAVRYDAFAGVPGPLVVVSAVFLAIAATNVVVIPELARGTAVGASSRDDEMPLGEVFRSAFVAILAAAMIAGSAASEPETTWKLLAAGVAGAGVASLLAARLVTQVRHHE